MSRDASAADSVSQDLIYLKCEKYRVGLCMYGMDGGGLENIKSGPDSTYQKFSATHSLSSRDRECHNGFESRVPDPPSYSVGVLAARSFIRLIELY